MPAATLTSKGQITLPKRIRDLLRVRAGDVVDFVIGDDGEIRVRAVNTDVASLRGRLQRPGRPAVSVARMNDAILKAARRT